MVVIKRDFEMKNIAIRFAFGALAISSGWILSGCAENGGFDDVVPGGGDERRFGVTVGGETVDKPDVENATGTRAESWDSSGGDMAGGTRAEYDPGAAGAEYLWSPGDEVGLFMVPTGGSEPVVANSPLRSLNTVPQRYAEFDGELTGEEIGRIDPAVKYDYYSYYPYSAAASATFEAGAPKVTFAMPAAIDVAPGVFPVEYGFMYATPELTPAGERPLTWLENGQQRFGEKVGFGYNHAFAWLEVSLALNLMSQPVTQIVVTCADGAMSGVANVNLRNGAMEFAAGSSNSLTVNIEGGMDIRSATDYDSIWIPINPALANRNFTFEFRSAAGASSVLTRQGGALQAGMKHKAAMKVPFRVNFAGIVGRNDTYGGDNITHWGYSFWKSGVNTAPNMKGLVGNSEDFNPFKVDGDCRVIYFAPAVGMFSGTSGELEAPEFKLVNSLGLTDVRVKVTFAASGNAVSGNDRIMRHGFTKSGIGSNLTGQTTLDRTTAKEYSFTGTLNSTTPNVKFRGETWGYYFIYMHEIRVEYAE